MPPRITPAHRAPPAAAPIALRPPRLLLTLALLLAALGLWPPAAAPVQAATTTRAEWGATSPANGQQLNGVSCTATNSCVAMGNTGIIRGWNGTTWSA